MAERIACTYCGQDWLVWYRVRADGRVFLLCPECDSVWLPGEDTTKKPEHSLNDLFQQGPRSNSWDLIEQVGDVYPHLP